MNRTDTIYESVTQSILDALEQGTPPWQRSWSIGSAQRLPRNFSTNNSYRGINALIFWMTAQKQGYSSQYWLTFNQARDLGGCVRKKEKGTRGIFYRLLERTDNASGETKSIPMARQFSAFNLDQIDGIEDPSTERLGQASPDENPEAETFIAQTGARIEFGAFSPCYLPTSDTIRCPERARFKSAGDYYATLTHELTHWTAHKTRLARDLSGKFGDASYAAEELVAELGSAFICADLGIQGTLQEHASYLDHWIEILKADERAIVSAASLASKAHQYLMATVDQARAA